VGVAEVTGVQSEQLCIAVMKSPLEGQKPLEGNLAYIKTVPASLALTTFEGCGARGAKTSALGEELTDALRAALQDTGKFTIAERGLYMPMPRRRRSCAPDTRRRHSP